MEWPWKHYETDVDEIYGYMSVKSCGIGLLGFVAWLNSARLYDFEVSFPSCLTVVLGFVGVGGIFHCYVLVIALEG